MLPNTTDFIQTMATILFLIGLVALGVGIYILSKQAFGQYLRALVEQTTKLAQKGIAEDVSGLVGNASSLIAALNQLVRETAGIGTLLISISFILIAGAYFLINQLR